ncbi:hypothetical protein AAVH_29350 [Aphelenchoides avenae]|nr:hypothetical protein AAVH_29350 [Aphelenchus avenae]
MNKRRGANKRRTHEAIREVLGDTLFLIRFPTMHSQEFTEGPVKDNILSAEEERDIYRSFHSAGRTSCAFSAESRTGQSAIPLRLFAPDRCPMCGARMNGDICPECGCSPRSVVECGRCNKWAEVDHVTPFTWTWGHDEQCDSPAYRCSCGAPNVVNGYGGHRCRRCGLKVWRCGQSDKMLVGTCECEHCKDEYGEDYSDDEPVLDGDDR